MTQLRSVTCHMGSHLPYAAPWLVRQSIRDTSHSLTLVLLQLILCCLNCFTPLSDYLHYIGLVCVALLFCFLLLARYVAKERVGLYAITEYNIDDRPTD